MSNVKSADDSGFGVGEIVFYLHQAGFDFFEVFLVFGPLAVVFGFHLLQLFLKLAGSSVAYLALASRLSSSSSLLALLRLASAVIFFLRDLCAAFELLNIEIGFGRGFSGHLVRPRWLIH